MLRALSGLRFLFAFMVFMAHCSIMKSMDGGWPAYLYNHFFRIGGYGVCFFFILSGFIISHAFGRNLVQGQLTVANFYKSRIKKLFPVHLFCFCLCIPPCISEITSSSNFDSFFKIISNLSLTQAYFNNHTIYLSFNSPSWSLSNELFFYLLFPLIVFTCHKIYITISKPLAVLFVVLLTGAIYITVIECEFAFYTNPLQNLCYFLFGFICYQIRPVCLKAIQNSGKFLVSIIEIGLLCLVFIYFFLCDNYVVNDYLKITGALPIGILILVLSADRGLLARCLGCSTLVFLGQISFSFYMIHQPVIRYMVYLNNHYLGFGSFVPLFTLILILTLLASVLLHRFIELKFQRISWNKTIFLFLNPIFRPKTQTRLGTENQP